MNSKDVSTLCLSVRRVRQATNDLYVKELDKVFIAGMPAWSDANTLELNNILDKLQECETALEQLQKEVWSSESSDE